MRTVSVIQREIPHYRLRFFEELCVRGRAVGLDVHVYCGMPPTQGSSPGFPYHVLPVRYFGRTTSSAYWLHGLAKATAGSDIIVAPQELQCLTVPYLWMRRRQICNTWIWWGHGYNFQAAVRPSVMTTMKEAVKGFVTRRGDGLITYTASGAEYWHARGAPEGWATPYYNTIDVEELRRAHAEVSDAQRLALRRTLKLEGKRVLLFSGRLYAEKKVDFLLRAYARLKMSCPDVGLVIIGDGAERDRLHRLAADLALHDVHFLGEVVDPRDTAAYFSLADLMVIPGLVGLAIVHGFAFGLPLITTDFPGHSPEIEYLTERTGVVTTMDPVRYAEAIAALLSSPDRLEGMRHSAMAQGDHLTLSHSVQRFVEGIQRMHALRQGAGADVYPQYADVA